MKKRPKIRRMKVPTKGPGVKLCPDLEYSLSHAPKRTRSLERIFYKNAIDLFNLLVPKDYQIKYRDTAVRITRIGYGPIEEFGYVGLFGNTLFTAIEAFGSVTDVEIKNAVEGTLIALDELDAPDNLNPNYTYSKILMLVVEDEPSVEERTHVYRTEDDVVTAGPVFMMRMSYDQEKKKIFRVNPKSGTDELTCDVLVINKKTDPEAYKLFMRTKKVLDELGTSTLVD